MNTRDPIPWQTRYAFAGFIVLALVLIVCSGCVHIPATKFDPATGNVISEGGVTAFMVRGEASKLSAKFAHTKTNYTRSVSVGSLSGETELDKVPSVLEAVAKGAAEGVTRALVKTQP